MTRLLRIAVFAPLLFCLPVTASAGSWIFERSYYTHDPVNKVRIGPQASGGPYYTPVRGEFVRTGVRYLRSQIRVGGMVFDQYNEWDAWVQTGAQF
jgi:hypothetical protein